MEINQQSKLRKWLSFTLFVITILGISLFLNIPLVSAQPIAPAEFEGKLEAVPAAPTLLSPSGEYAFPRPNYIWLEVPDASRYRVFISSAVTGTVSDFWYFDNYVCPGSAGGSGECGLLGYDHLRTGNHTWWVKGWNDEGSGDWSAPMNFRVWNTTPPSGTVTLTYPANNADFTFWKFGFTWEPNERASWYKVYMSDSEGKLYNQYHRAAELCEQNICGLGPMTYEPLLHAPRGLSELPTNRWIHWYVMPVNVGGNGDWSDDYKFWMYPP